MAYRGNVLGFTTDTAPNNGLIVSGNVGFGTSSLLSSADFNYTGNTTYLYLFRGQNTFSSSPTQGVYSTVNFFCNQFHCKCSPNWSAS
jgi:hypothetical protein